jgi:hypothetical protein
MRYTLHGFLPDGEVLVIRAMVDREEAEDMAEVLCRVTAELEQAEDFDSTPRRKENTWYVRSKDWRRDGAVLCWLEAHEGRMMNYFQRFETKNPKTGLAVLYELKRNPTVMAAAYEEGVHLGRATLPLDVWEQILQTPYLADKYGLSADEVAELAGIHKDFEQVAKRGDGDDS